jgi:hypothetical protein
MSKMNDLIHVDTDKSSKLVHELKSQVERMEGSLKTLQSRTEKDFKKASDDLASKLKEDLAAFMEAKGDKDEVSKMDDSKIEGHIKKSVNNKM